jgi:hypothetical protein
LHLNAAGGDGHSVCGGFGPHVHHVGLTLSVKMGQGGRVVHEGLWQDELNIKDLNLHRLDILLE